MTKKAAKKATAKKKAAKKTPSKATATKGDLQAVKDLGTANDKLKAELSKTIVGMDNVIEEPADLASLPPFPGINSTL